MSDTTEIRYDDDDGSIRTTVTATAPDWALDGAARELADAVYETMSGDDD